MGKASKLSAFGCIAGFVLVLQLGLHTQLLQRRGGVYEYGNLTDEIDQYADTLQLPASSALYTSSNQNSANYADVNFNTRNKRFLQRLRNSFEIDSNSNQETEKTESQASESSSQSFVASSSDTSNVVDEGNPWEGVSSELTIGNYYSGNFTWPNTHLCSKKGSNLTLLVLVPSAISNFRQRESVRRTWGSFAARRDVAIGFVIGNPKLAKVNETVVEKFQSEIDLFGDIIIADFKDSYKNLTLKVLFMIDWASRYCDNAKFYMKTDDDVFLNVPLLLNFISKIQENDLKQPKIYGNVFSGHLPQRNVTHKHFVNYEVYPHKIHYPNFTSGPAYLISSAVLKPLLKQAVRLPLFNLEDVLLNGFAASALGIPRVNVTQFRNELENPYDMPVCKLVSTIAGMTDGSQTQIYRVWYNYLMGTITCRHSLQRRR